MFSCTLKIGGSVLALAIGLYLYAIATSKWVKQKLLAIGQSIPCQSQSGRNSLRKQFIEYIEFYSNLRRWATALLTESTLFILNHSIKKILRNWKEKFTGTVRLAEPAPLILTILNSKLNGIEFLKIPAFKLDWSMIFRTYSNNLSR